MGLHRCGMVEELESRRLLSGATILDGVLKITAGTRGPNTISFDPAGDGANYVIHVSTQVLHGKPVAPVDIPFPMNGVNAVRIIGGSFGDHVEVGAIPVPVAIIEGKGNDVITDDAAFGTIHGGSGNDTLDIGNGDIVVHTGNGNSSITAGDGSNRILAGAGNQHIWVGNGSNTIIGGQGAETIYTGGGDNVILAGAGTATIVAGNGNNTLWAGNGRDTLIAGSGNNTFGVTTGTHTMAGGSGNNTFIAPDMNTFDRQHTNYDSTKDTILLGQVNTRLRAKLGV